MIQILDHTNQEVAIAIREVFQASYAIEAQLLNAINFPPLQRQLNAFMDCNTTFYGYFNDDSLAAVTEIKENGNSTHIQSLVVLPEYFKQGIAQKLITHTIITYNPELLTVETGADNFPACQLYEKMGFTQTRKWMTKHDIVKVHYKRIMSTPDTF